MEKYLDDMIFFNGSLITPDELINVIKTYIKDLQRKKDNAIKTVNEYNKDEEIQKLKDEITSLKHEYYETTSFKINEEEQNNINEWIKNHIKEKHNNNSSSGAIGGKFIYQFTPTSIGDIGEIVCFCGEKYCFKNIK